MCILNNAAVVCSCLQFVVGDQVSYTYVGVKVAHVMSAEFVHEEDTDVFTMTLFVFSFVWSLTLFKDHHVYNMAV